MAACSGQVGRRPPTPTPADEIDAIGTKRFDSQTGADREVQRILMELLNQMDGFDQTVNVKVGRGCGGAVGPRGYGAAGLWVRFREFLG